MQREWVLPVLLLQVSVTQHGFSYLSVISGPGGGSVDLGSEEQELEEEPQTPGPVMEVEEEGEITLAEIITGEKITKRIFGYP